MTDNPDTCSDTSSTYGCFNGPKEMTLCYTGCSCNEWYNDGCNSMWWSCQDSLTGDASEIIRNQKVKFEMIDGQSGALLSRGTINAGVRYPL